MAVVLGGTSVVVADTINVPADYQTIQAAILAALEGDEIIVAPGFYNEALFFNGHNITLRSESGPEVTIIDATGFNTAVRVVLGESPTIDGFTIANGTIGILSQNPGSNPTILNCICIGNDRGIYVLGNATSTVRNSRIINSAIYGVSVSGQESSVELEDCYIADSTIEGIYVLGRGDLFATRCELRRNGVLIQESQYPAAVTLIDCLIVENAGSGVRLKGNASADDVLTLINCTVANNQGSGVRAGNWTVSLANTIIWGNDSTSLEASLGSDISYCDIEGGFPGCNFCVLADPLFVDPTAEDFRLAAGSPCIDLGNNAAVPKGVDTDIDGAPRFVDDADTRDCPQPGANCGSAPIVDMGAYEFQAGACPWDLDRNGSVGASDLLILLVNWGKPYGASDLLSLLVAWGPCS